METQELFLPLPDHDMDMHTAYIQAALDKCREGGGVLRLAPGDWRIASLRLYDNTTLYLSSGTHLIASNRWQDYTDFHVPTTLGYLKSPFLQKKWRLPDHYVNSPITAIDAENVAVIGGGLTGSEIAYELALQGKEVTIVEMKDDLVSQKGVCLANSSYLREWFALHEVPVYLETTLKEVKDGCIICTGKDGEVTIPCDSVICSAGYLPAPIAKEGGKVHLVGDCRKVGNLRSVIWRAYEVAMAIK